MTLIQSIILGIIQGVSEFLPISSSGHLVLAPILFGWEFTQDEAFIFDVLVQVASLIAVIIYFREDLALILRAMIDGIRSETPFGNAQSKLGWFLFLSTIPAITIAILFKVEIERSFNNPGAVSYFLLFTSFLLIIGELFGKKSKGISTITGLDALLIGLAQAMSLFPGISRSGSTISAGLVRNMDREASAKISFLMSIPVMLAAGVVALIDLFQSPHLFVQLPVYLAGFLTSAIVGYLTIRWFIKFLAHQSLYIFAAYCAFAGTILLTLTHG